MKHIPKLIALIVLGAFLESCSEPAPNSSGAPPKTPGTQNLAFSQPDNEDCFQAARKTLGVNAEILKCAHLSDPAHLEAVAAIRVPGLKEDRYGIPVSRLVILRRGNLKWETELNVDKEVTNRAGYVGINFIDDAQPFPYYRVYFSGQWGARDPSQFTLILTSMGRNGRIDVDDHGMAIGWNPVVGRFQQIEPNGVEFAPEVKAPKHIRGSHGKN